MPTPRDNSSPPPASRERPGPAARKAGRVISDLHLYSSRSRAGEQMDAIHAAAAEADHFVFNGDTFDFRWTTRASIEATIPEAIGWVDRLVAAHPRCHFNFVLGNHDFVAEFIEAMEELTGRTPNLSTHPYHVRLGEAVFLHGDVPAMNVDAARMARHRSQFLRERRKHPALSKVYDAITATGVHRAIGLVHSPGRQAARIESHLRHVEPDAIDAIEHVYCGHTHVPFTGFRYAGKTFHNTGSMIRGLRHQMLRFEFTG